MGSRKRGRSKTQKPCARLRDADLDAGSASGDPAMVFMSRMASILSGSTGTCPFRPAAGLLLDDVAHDRFQKPRQGFEIMRKRAQTGARDLQYQRRMLCFSSNAL